MSEIASQDIIPAVFGEYVTLGDSEKRSIEDAGQALIRGEAGAVDSLIAAASPLCVIVTGRFVKPYKRLWPRRKEFREQAREAVSKAVAYLDRRFRDGSLTALKSTFRAYLSKCIRSHLIRYSQRCDKAKRDKLAQSFTLEKSGLDWIEILSLSARERKVYVMRMRGKKWKEIAASIGKCKKTAERIFKRVVAKIAGKAAA